MAAENIIESDQWIQKLSLNEYKERFPQEFQPRSVSFDNDAIYFFAERLNIQVGREVTDGERSANKTISEEQRDPLEPLARTFTIASVNASQSKDSSHRTKIRLTHYDILWLKSLLQEHVDNFGLDQKKTDEIYLALSQNFQHSPLVSVSGDEMRAFQPPFFNRLASKLRGRKV